MSDPDWYGDWRHEAVHILQAKNAALGEQFRIDDWPRYDYNLDHRQLIFSKNGEPRVIADIQVVGSTSAAAGNWLWSWGNSHWPLDCTEDAERVRDFGELHGISQLTEDYVESGDLNGLGWELTAIAARVCNAPGAYRPKRDEGGGLFLLYRAVHWVT
jgi:hypothetical protein